MGDQNLTDHLGGQFFGFRRSVAEMNPAFEPAPECTFATTSGMDLCLDDKPSSKAGSHIFRLFGGVGYGSWLGGHTKFREKFAGLKFMDIHVVER